MMTRTEATTMIDLGKRSWILFDGDCGICTWFADRAMRMDVQRYFYIEPFQRFADADFQPFGLSRADCLRRLQVISRKGAVHSGAFGVNFLLVHYFPWKLLVILLYLVPPLLFTEIAVYELMAINRTRLSRWLGMKACLVEKDEHSSA